MWTCYPGEDDSLPHSLTSAIVQIIFSFWSFEMSEGNLRNQKIIIGLDSFSNQHLRFWFHLDYTSFCIDYPVRSCKMAKILFGSMLSNL